MTCVVHEFRLFSPTDTMPLTSRAKVLMAVQATAASITSLLVIARAVGARPWAAGLGPIYWAACCTVSLASVAWFLTSAAAVVASPRTVSVA